MSSSRHNRRPEHPHHHPPPALAVGRRRSDPPRRVERLHAETQAALAQAGDAHRVHRLPCPAHRRSSTAWATSWATSAATPPGPLGRRAGGHAHRLRHRAAQPAPAHVADPAEVPELPDDLEDPIGLLRTCRSGASSMPASWPPSSAARCPRCSSTCEGAIEGEARGGERRGLTHQRPEPVPPAGHRRPGGGGR